jgi:hypothetical protein
MPDCSASRRTFLAALGTAASGTLLAPLLVDAASGTAEASEAPQSEWDLSWLGEMKGKHRQVFDVARKIEDIPGPLHTVNNYLDAWKEVYRLEFPDVNTLLGIAGSGFPINVNHAIWAKYEIADRWQISDGPNKSPDHNVFLEAPANDAKRASVKALQARGTIFCQCNKALKRISVEFALASHDTADNVYAELVAGLNPGVRLVPANAMLLGLAQEHGCAYESV